MKTDTQLMDMMEEAVVGAAEALLEAVLDKSDMEKLGIPLNLAARNMVAKVGSRIMFGKETYDQAMAKKSN